MAAKSKKHTNWKDRSVDGGMNGRAELHVLLSVKPGHSANLLDDKNLGKICKIAQHVTNKASWPRVCRLEQGELVVVVARWCAPAAAAAATCRAVVGCFPPRASPQAGCSPFPWGMLDAMAGVVQSLGIASYTMIFRKTMSATDAARRPLH